MAITKYEGKTFTNQTFQLEESWFVNCVLRGCFIFYRGGPFELENATFDDKCQWKFQGEARNTVQLLQMIGMLKGQPVPPQAVLNTPKGPVN